MLEKKLVDGPCWYFARKAMIQDMRRRSYRSSQFCLFKVAACDVTRCALSSVGHGSFGLALKIGHDGFEDER